MSGLKDPAIISYAELVLRPRFPVELHPGKTVWIFSMGIKRLFDFLGRELTLDECKETTGIRMQINKKISILPILSYICFDNESGLLIIETK